MGVGLLAIGCFAEYLKLGDRSLSVQLRLPYQLSERESLTYKRRHVYMTACQRSITEINVRFQGRLQSVSKSIRGRLFHLDPDSGKIENPKNDLFLLLLHSFLFFIVKQQKPAAFTRLRK